MNPLESAFMTPARGISALRARLHASARSLGPAGPMAAIAVLLPVAGAALVLGTVKQLGPWVRDQGALGPLLIASIGAATVGTCVVPTYVVSILAGWSFGFGAGFLTALVTLTVAALVGFAVARRVVGDHVMDRLRDARKWDALRRAMVGGHIGRATLIVALVRLAPVAPFGITNLVMAATRCPRRAFVVGSVLGMIPQTALLVFLATRLKELNFERDSSVAVFAIASTVAASLTLGYIAKRALAQVTRDAALAA